MKTVDRSAIVTYTPEQMFHLVNDIDRYATFLPWCSASKAIVQPDQTVQGELVINKAGIVKSFTTVNTLHAPDRIDMHLLNGPFKSLSGQWLFEPLGETGCKVRLVLNFELEYGWMGRMLAKVFEGIANNLVNAFCQEAKRRYD